MKLVFVAFASILCASAARAGDEALLPLRSLPTSYSPGVTAVDLDGNGRKELVCLSSGGEADPPTMTVLSLGTHGDVLSQSSPVTSFLGNTAVADFDGDGREDLAIAGDNASVHVFRGGADGLPTLWQTVPVGASALGIESADFDGDTWPDLLVSEQNASSTKPFRLLRNLGGTGFQVQTAVSGSGMEPRQMALADLNADGKLDVLACELGPERVRVLLAQPSGTTFTTLGTHPTVDKPGAVEALDLTADGLPDMAVSLAMGQPFMTTGVSCRAGAGGGNFGAEQYTPIYQSTGSLGAMDIDGDADLDLVLGSIDNWTWSVTNVGALPLPAAKPIRSLSDAAGVLVSDLNGDGFRDLVALPAAGSTLALLFGSAQGLHRPITTPLASLPLTLHAADLTGDGKSDLLSLGGTYAGTWLSVADGHGDGSFGAPLTTNLPNLFWAQISALGLCTDDALPDVVVVGENVSGTQQLRLLVNRGLGNTFGPGGLIGLGAKPTAGPIVVDLDGDGEVEICVPTLAGLVRIFHVGAGNSLVAAGSVPVPEFAFAPQTVDLPVAGDLDEDGFLDIAVGLQLQHKVFVLPGLPGGGLGAATILDAAPSGGATRNALVADLDEDGLQDVIGTGFAVPSVQWLGQAGMSFAAPQPLSDGAQSPAVADIDGDGHVDLVGIAIIAGDHSSLRVLRGLGNGQFQPALKFATWADRVAVADFTSDGVPDVVTSGTVFGPQGYPPDAEDACLYVSRPYTQFDDVGYALGGNLGEPEFFAWGWLKPGKPVTFSVARAKPLAPAALFAGLSQAMLPFKGGTLVPSIDVLLPMFVTDSKGRIELGLPWPAGVPSGIELTLQWWFADATGPKGFTASNALSASTP